MKYSLVSFTIYFYLEIFIIIKDFNSACMGAAS
jgi:hypothetical protein